MAGTVSFRPEKFTDVLNGAQSWQLVYFPSTICPCRHRSDGSPVLECANCLGYGYSWPQPEQLEQLATFYMGSETRPPVLEHAFVGPAALIEVRDEHGAVYGDATLVDGRVVFGATEPPHGTEFTVRYLAPQTVRGLVTNLMSHREWREMGEVHHRDLHLTVDRYLKTPHTTDNLNPVWQLIGEHDRFLVPHARIRTQQVLHRGEREHLTYGYVFSVERCYSLTSAFAPTEYLEGEDFTLENGAVVWAEGKGPTAGRPYAIVYEAAPEYYVWRDLPQVRHQGGLELPRRVALRLWEQYPRPGASYGRS
jgi:hypothetical protein